METTGHITDLNNKDFRLLKPIPIRIVSTASGYVVSVRHEGICRWNYDESETKVVNSLIEELIDSFIDLIQRIPLSRLRKDMRREAGILMEYIEEIKPGESRLCYEIGEWR